MGVSRINHNPYNKIQFPLVLVQKKKRQGEGGKEGEKRMWWGQKRERMNEFQMMLFTWNYIVVTQRSL